MSRIFLVGNGASLKRTPLDLLKFEFSMAVNKIHMIYPHTVWRPTHYMKVDYSAFAGDNWKEEVMPHILRGEQCLLWDAFRAGADKYDGNYEYIPDGIGDFDNVTYIPRCNHHYLATGDWHEICTGCNSILTMMIWAVQLGFEKIYLVGCDGEYSTPDKDHFDDKYYEKWDETYAARNNKMTRLAHDIAKGKCPVPVINCTVGGSLDMWPREKLEDVL